MATESAGRMPPKFGFRYTCPRHQEMFIAIARRAGCEDPAAIDELRRRMLAWMSVRFSRMVLDHFNEGSCLGCKLEANRVNPAEIERAITKLATEICVKGS